MLLHFKENTLLNYLFLCDESEFKDKYLAQFEVFLDQKRRVNSIRIKCNKQPYDLLRFTNICLFFTELSGIDYIVYCLIRLYDTECFTIS